MCGGVIVWGKIWDQRVGNVRLVSEPQVRVLLMELTCLCSFPETACEPLASELVCNLQIS